MLGMPKKKVYTNGRREHQSEKGNINIERAPIIEPPKGNQSKKGQIKKDNYLKSGAITIPAEA